MRWRYEKGALRHRSKAVTIEIRQSQGNPNQCVVFVNEHFGRLFDNFMQALEYAELRHTIAVSDYEVKQARLEAEKVTLIGEP